MIGILYSPTIDVNKLKKLMDIIKDEWKEIMWLSSSFNNTKIYQFISQTTRLISVGGDGTALKTAHIAMALKIPVIAINAGHLGFLTDISIDEIEEKLPLYQGICMRDERAMAKASIITKEGTIASTHYALNDVVVGHGAMSQVIYVKAYIDGAYLTTYKGDGVIVSTATGSTGYSLSVGGAILDSKSRDLMMIPIAGHLSFNAPLVLNYTSGVVLEIASDNTPTVTIDGKQVEYVMRKGDKVEICGSRYSTVFLKVQGRNYFYETLMERLKLRV